MSRALKFTLLIGMQVSLLLALIHASGAMRSLDASLARAFGLASPPAEHPALQVFMFIALAFGVAWTSVDINRPPLKAAIAAAAVAEMLTLAAVCALFGAYFSPFLPGAAAALAFAGGFVYSRSPGGQRQRTVDAAFGQRLSVRHNKTLVDGQAPLDAGGQMQELTVVACEIFNHQQLMDALSPADYVALSNLFLGLAAETLVERGGCLMACDGEGARVIFGAPLPMPGHAVTACRAVLELLRKVKMLNEQTALEHNGLTCDLRVGVNSGEMAAGRFGTERLGGFGVAGEEVAFARRLCAANLIYGSTALIGARTYSLAESAIEARPLELLRRRVGADWLEVYELLGEPHDLTSADIARRDLFWTGVIFYREKRLADALAKFSQAREAMEGPDGPLDFYLQRIKQLQHSRSTDDWETARLINSL